MIKYYLPRVACQSLTGLNQVRNIIHPDPNLNPNPNPNLDPDPNLNLLLPFNPLRDCTMIKYFLKGAARQSLTGLNQVRNINQS